MSALQPITPDPKYALTASGNLRRRQITSRVFEVLTVVAAAIAVIVLVILVYYVIKQGVSALSFSFLFSGQLPDVEGQGGGIGPALLGSIELILIATIIAVPAGVLTAIFITQYAGRRLDYLLRTVIDLMASLPAIVVGVFVAGLISDPLGQSAWSGGVALALIEVPLIASASLEAISRVPPTLNEAAEALGVARWRSVVGVILPTSMSGIVTATILAVARAAGEAAPILFCCSLFAPTIQLNPLHAVPSVPLVILQLLETGYPAAIAKAWGAAFVLMFVILIANIGARVWLRQANKKRGL